MRVAGPNAVVCSKERVRRNGAPAAPSRCPARACWVSCSCKCRSRRGRPHDGGGVARSVVHPATAELVAADGPHPRFSRSRSSKTSWPRSSGCPDRCCLIAVGTGREAPRPRPRSTEGSGLARRSGPAFRGRGPPSRSVGRWRSGSGFTHERAEHSSVPSESFGQGGHVVDRDVRRNDEALAAHLRRGLEQSGAASQHGLGE